MILSTLKQFLNKQDIVLTESDIEAIKAETAAEIELENVNAEREVLVEVVQDELKDVLELSEEVEDLDKYEQALKTIEKLKGLITDEHLLSFLEVSKIALEKGEGKGADIAAKHIEDLKGVMEKKAQDAANDKAKMREIMEIIILLGMLYVHLGSEEPVPVEIARETHSRIQQENRPSEELSIKTE